MKRIENLQEKLKNLPTFTLNNEQKNNIILSLKNKRNKKKRMQLFVPFISFIVICATAILLFISEGNEGTNWLNGVKQTFQSQVELTAIEGEVFPHTSYEVIGIEGKLGILVFNQQFVAEDTRRGAKIMLYYWGDTSEFAGESFRVEARNSYNTKITLSEGDFDGFLFGEDVQQILTSFTAFPIEGKWELSFLVNEQLFEEFTLEVLPPFPKTKAYHLMDSPKEIKVGVETEINITSVSGDKKEIEVKLLNEIGNIVSEQIFIQDGEFIDAATSQTIYEYVGKIEFAEEGSWKLEIDGEKTNSFNN